MAAMRPLLLIIVCASCFGQSAQQQFTALDVKLFPALADYTRQVRMVEGTRDRTARANLLRSVVATCHVSNDALFQEANDFTKLILTRFPGRTLKTQQPWFSCTQRPHAMLESYRNISQLAASIK